MPRPVPIALAALLVFAASTASAEELIDGIAAQVGSDVVLISEVTGVTDAMEEQMRAAGATLDRGSGPLPRVG